MERIRQEIHRLFEGLERGRKFIRHDIWHIGKPGEEAPHGFIIKQVRVMILLVQSLVEDTLLLRAAALTFTAMLAAVPLLALIFLVIQQLNLGRDLPKLMDDFLGQPSGETQQVAQNDANPNDLVRQGIVKWLFQGMEELGENGAPGAPVGDGASTSPEGTPQEPGNTKDGKSNLPSPIELIMTLAEDGADPATIGITGVFFILTTVLGLMRNIESSFNAIWGVRQTRSWYRMFSDYVMVILLLPFLAATVVSVTTVLESRWDIEEGLGNLALASTRYVVIWTVFTVMFWVVPNTRVKFRYAVLGGVVAGTVWLLATAAYVNFMFGMTRFNLLYSGVALFPLFLMWMYVSWIILLFGAELSFAYQNEKTFAMERLSAGASPAYREALGVRAMTEVARRFDLAQSGLISEESAREWGVPTRLLNDTLESLTEAGLVQKCATQPVTYQPGRSIGRISIGDVVRALRESGRDPSDLRADPDLRPILDEVNGVDNSLMNTSLADVVRQDLFANAPRTQEG